MCDGYWETVSTHSRPKAAGQDKRYLEFIHDVSTHSRPKAAGNYRWLVYLFKLVSTHSRPKAAGRQQQNQSHSIDQFQHTAARRRLGQADSPKIISAEFQHTAARRRLDHAEVINQFRLNGFNTQPPEGGWDPRISALSRANGFNTQPPEGGWFPKQKRQ